MTNGNGHAKRNGKPVRPQNKYLKPLKKGERPPNSGEKPGKPKLTHYLKQILNTTTVPVTGADGIVRQVPTIEAYADELLRLARKDARFAKLVLERVDPVTHDVSITGQVNVTTAQLAEWADAADIALDQLIQSRTSGRT